MLDKLSRWWEISQQLASLKDEEQRLRKEIFDECFTEAVEGTNKHELPDGYTLIAKYPLNRSVVEETLDTMRDELVEAGIDWTRLIKYKPSLVTSEYRKMTAEEQRLFDLCLHIKPGMPSLEIKAPKVKKG